MPKPQGDSTSSVRGLGRRKRLARIEELLLENKSGAEIVREIQRDFLSEQGAPLSERGIYYDIREVWERIKKRYEADRDTLHAMARAKWERREQLADKMKDLKAGNAALDAWTKLHGLYAPKKAELKVEGAVRVDVNVQVRGIVGVLSERGLAALRVLHEEIEAARAAGRLPAVPAPAAVEPDEDDEPVPVPVLPPAEGVN